MPRRLGPAGFPQACPFLLNLESFGDCVGYNAPMISRLHLGVVFTLFVVVFGAGCAPSLDTTESLRMTQISSGWFNAGLDTLGRNKLVPTVSFRLENTTDDTIRYVQLNGVFRREGEEEEWGTSYVHAFGTEGLDAGLSTIEYRLESERGYTGEQARDEMLAHSGFVDVRMDLFVKHRGDQWVRLDSIDIDRQLLTQ